MMPLMAAGGSMIQVGIILFSLFSFTAIASDFQHIKLHPQFEDYITRPKMKSMGARTHSLMAEPSDTGDYAQKIRTVLLGSKLTGPIPTDGEESPLYEEITRHLEAAHESIGAREVTQLDVLNRQFNLGTQNISGFSWQKPFGVVHVFADRQVTPNLFGENWLIQDTFTFDIEATSFLEKTNEAGITAMSAAEIGAFAGITFKRVYTYYHYANSYQEGLRADFSKLFLPFLRFNKQGIDRLSQEEIIKREDNWSARVGGLIRTPPLYHVSFSAGILAEFAYQNLVSVQVNSPINADEEKLRIALRGKKSVNMGATLALQLDFFKLLKISLMSADLNYQYADAREFTLGLNSHQWEAVKTNDVQEREMKSILRGTGDIRALEPYIVRLDESTSSSLEFRRALLIWGKLQKSKTEQVRVIKDEMVKLFYKNYSQSVRVVQNFFSRIFSAVIYKVFKLPMGINNAALYNRQVTLEYEATHPQSADADIQRIETTEQFSFIINQSYEASRTDRWIDRKFKNDVIWFIDSFTTLPKDYKSIVRQEQLRGPLRIESNLRVEKAGFDYLLLLDESTVFGQISEVCHSPRKEEWQDPDKRKVFLRRLQIGAEACVKDLGEKFLAFREDYQANSRQPSLALFKSFLTKYYKKTDGLDDLIPLFGEENVFINGQLKATTSQGGSFVTSFSSGQFRGLGVIDNFKRSTGSRMPASIVSE
jgi:hypothetical protein